MKSNLHYNAPCDARPIRSFERPVSDDEVERFKLALRYIRKNFRTAGLHDIAAHVGYSLFHFHRRFTLWAGRTPKSIVTELQINLACKLLLAGKASLPEIAQRCGFAHQSHLTSRFRLCMGDAPLRWLRRQRRAGSEPIRRELVPLRDAA